jgi:diadenosine tetraphosphate (Ap4A) HIT family hydrolase
MNRPAGTRRTWPADWEARVEGKDCPMCAEGRADTTHDGSELVYRSTFVDAYLQRASGVRGYSVVVWRGRHVAEPTELSSAEASGYWLDLLKVGRALEILYRPAKLNYETWGNWVPHLHTHVIPRYLDDPDPGRPPEFLRSDAPPSPRSAGEYADDVSALRGLLMGSSPPSPRDLGSERPASEAI